MTFLDENYLLSNGVSRRIFKEVRGLPILDAHNHANVSEIRKNENYPDIWHIEAATDHYVWELLRKRGVDENYITGTASNKEKWLKLASVFEEFVGNAVYEWVHLDLMRILGIELLINEANAEEIWTKAGSLLKTEQMKPKSLLKTMNVEVMCSTDDPIDFLEDHKTLKEDQNFKTRILPTWRPDKAMNIFKPDFPEYIKKLEARVNKSIKNIDNLIQALQETHDYFDTLGARASDHGIEVPLGYTVEKARADEIFQDRLSGKVLSKEEKRDFISFMLHQFGRMNEKSCWVMQIHIGAVRDVRDSLYKSLGPDSGGDVSNHLVPILEPLKDFLNAFNGKLKIVLYCLDPNHMPTLATLSRAFGKNVSLGSAWWFNDTPIGIKRQLEYIGSVDLLMSFAGMVTDSRKLLSYGSRTEMFRRVLSDVLGEMVEKGQMPEELAIRAAKYICFDRIKELFGF